jgi:hypothetical protein
MFLCEVLPQVQSLRRDEKRQLYQILARELGLETGGHSPEAQTPSTALSLDRAFDAAAILLRVLQNERDEP